MSMGDDAQNADEEFVDELKPGTRLMLGQYTIDRFLAAGGFGITYLATDSLKRPIVIKECFPGSFCRRQNHSVMPRSRAHQDELKSIVRHFSQEAVTLSKAGHPNIVGVHQVFEENNTAYMALDFVDGRDLLEILKDDPESLTPDRVVRYLNRMLDAIGHVHARGLLHRDISPDNIIINQNDEPVLIDFGAARETADKKASRLLSALRVVKDGYSPQEFYIAGSQQTASCDLYSLAASFYHVITGELPPDSQSRLTAFAAGDPDPYVPLAKRGKGYSKNFASALDKAMSILPKERMQTAEEWLSHIEQGPGDAVVTPSRPKAASKPTQKAAKSSMPVLLGGTALVAAAGAGLLYFATQPPETFDATEEPAQSASVITNEIEPDAAEDTTLAVNAPEVIEAAPEEAEDFAFAPTEVDEEPPIETGTPSAPGFVVASPAETPLSDEGDDAEPEVDVALAPPSGLESDDGESAIDVATDTASLDAPVTEEEPAAPAPVPVEDVARQTVEPIEAPSQEAPVASTEETDIADAEPAVTEESEIRVTASQVPRPRPVRTPAAPEVVAEEETEIAADTADPATGDSGASAPESAPVVAEASPTPAPTVSADIATIEASSVMERNVPFIPFTLSGSEPGVVDTVAENAPFWLTNGVRIVSVEGVAVKENADIMGLIRKAVEDAGGETAVTIGTDALLSNAAIERRLTIASERQTALLNGLVFVSRKEGGEVVTRVTQAPDGSTFKVGDKVVAFMATGERLDASTTMKSILDRELAAGQTNFSFAVEREGQMWVEGFTLAALTE